MYGRIFKTLHVLTFVDDPAYRRETDRPDKIASANPPPDPGR